MVKGNEKYVIARSEATWQSPGTIFPSAHAESYGECNSTISFGFAVVETMKQEIATSASPPRNDSVIGNDSAAQPPKPSPGGRWPSESEVG